MDTDSWLLILIFAALLLLGAYFAAAETAFASASRIRIKNRADRGERRANRALDILDRFDQAITTILIGTNVVHIAAASLAALFVTRKWGSGAVAWATFVTTLVVFFVSEMLPKSIAKKYSETLSLWAAPSLHLLMVLLTPLSFLLTAFGKAAAKMTKGDGDVSVTEDELYDIIENLTEEGSLDEEKGDLVTSALEFGDVTAGDILTARVDVAALDVESTTEEVLQEVKRQRHSRLPVYKGSVDHIIGILQIRKFLKAYLHADGGSLDWNSLLDEPYFVHSSMNADELLRELSRRKLNLAVVTDSTGGTLGILTVEDIVEELVGEIWDEDDVVVEPMVQLDGGAWDMDASLQAEEVFEKLGFEDPEDQDLSHKTLGEWAYEQFDSIPRQGDTFTYHGLSVTVSQQKERRVMRLRVELMPPEAAESEQEGGDAQ